MLRHTGILARSLLQARGFSFAFLVTLSVALGGSTVVFGVVRTLLFRPLPYSDVERLVVATPTVTWGMYAAMRDSLSILEQSAAYIEQAANVSVGGHVERTMVAHVTSTFFQVTGVRPALGRLWDERESGGSSQPVVLISDDFKRRHFGNERDAIGTLKWERAYVVVGVVENSLEGYPGEAPQPTVYLNHEQSQRPVPQMTFLVRAPAASEALARSLAEVVRRVLPGHPLYNVLTLDRIVSAKFARERIISSMMLVFALLALLVAGGGVHGAVAYALTSRIHEIGVRRALGGSDPRILSEVVLRGMKLVAAGLVVGMHVALGLRWLAEAQFVGAAGTDFFTCVMAIILVLGVGAVACAGPARRALRIDPIETLRMQ